MITVSAISYFSVINAATLSSVPDTASSYTTDICEPTIVAQETVLFILSNPRKTIYLLPTEIFTTSVLMRLLQPDMDGPTNGL